MSSTQTADPSGIWMEALKRAFARRSFVVAVIIMATAAIGLSTATEFLQLHFKKQPVPLVKELESVPAELGPWVQVSSDERLEADIEHTLGTKLYIFRIYVDSRQVGKAKVDEILSKSGLERRRVLNDLEARHPRWVMHLAVTYYTGLVDTVAHVADRCYIADGYAPTEYDLKKWNRNGQGDEVEVRFINFEDATGFGGASRQSKTVGYFFQVNGDLVSSPIDVRVRLQNLFVPKAYYAKVELMSLVQNREEASRTMSDFLSYAFPEIQKCLPGAPDSQLVDDKSEEASVG